MYRIIKIGMDVHSKNYTLCAMEPVIGEKDRIFANIQVTADYKSKGTGLFCMGNDDR